MTIEEVKARAVEQLESVGYTVLETHGEFDIIAINRLGLRFIKVIKEEQGLENEYLGIRDRLKYIPHQPRATYEIWVYSDEYGWKMQNVIEEVAK
ncbi:hypothetical protein [Mahella australiensis]|uniref:Uncharacterized protein n=1 Tax=Mahella australiensis (strain DSM 15567 / CIP 107919 / 50-1 BON) TaxID=697281 RepID=F3ZZF5_MAHA5|nr:hypothetical protein [Mahella australiensis]AEE95765.1 hypothetical protein Mahau_0561 [Mahella australiensis 50-1 BON]